MLNSPGRVSIPWAKELAPVVAPHSQKCSVNLIWRLVELVHAEPHHASVIHAPWQAHQRAVERLLAPIGDESAAEWRIERNLQLVDSHRSLNDLNDIDALYRSPPDQSEGLDEDAVLIGAHRRPIGLQQGKVVVAEARRRYCESQPVRGTGCPSGCEKNRRHRGGDIHGKLHVLAAISHRVDAGTLLIAACAHVGFYA